MYFSNYINRIYLKTGTNSNCLLNIYQLQLKLKDYILKNISIIFYNLKKQSEIRVRCLRDFKIKSSISLKYLKNISSGSSVLLMNIFSYYGLRYL